CIVSPSGPRSESPESQNQWSPPPDEICSRDVHWICQNLVLNDWNPAAVILCSAFRRGVTLSLDQVLIHSATMRSPVPEGDARCRRGGVIRVTSTCCLFSFVHAVARDRHAGFFGCECRFCR